MHPSGEQSDKFYPFQYILWSNVHISHNANKGFYFYPEEVVKCHMLLGVIPPVICKNPVWVPPGDDSCPGGQQVSPYTHFSVQKPPLPPQ